MDNAAKSYVADVMMRYELSPSKVIMTSLLIANRLPRGLLGTIYWVLLIMVGRICIFRNMMIPRRRKYAAPQCGTLIRASRLRMHGVIRIYIIMTNCSEVIIMLCKGICPLLAKYRKYGLRPYG